MLTPELEKIIQEFADNDAGMFDKFDELGIDFDDWGSIIYEYKQKYPPTKSMGIQLNKNRSDAYIGTFDYECADDMLQLNEVRGMVKNMNRMLREDGYDYQYYVKCQGRGTNRTARMKTWLSNKYNRPVSDHWAQDAGQRSLPLEIADRVDAYIYRRR